MPDGNPTGGQGEVTDTVQPRPGVVLDPYAGHDVFYISPAAQRYMGYRMEAVPGAPPAVAQGGEGQGQGAGGGDVQPKGGGEGFNWGLFPDVPEAERPLLEPHLKNVQGHVTKLEQDHAPWKALAEAGVDPQAIQSLVAFDQNFSQDPFGTWLALAENMQKEGVLSDELDLSVVKAIQEGKDAGGEGAGGPDNGQPGEGEQIPSWAQQMMQENEELKQRLDGREQSEAAQQRAQQLQTALGQMKSQLTEAGYTEENLPDDNALTGLLIAHQGDVAKVIASLTGLREGVLKGLTTNGKEPDDPESGGEGPDMPKGAPSVAKRTGGRSRAFAKANQGAQQMLEAKQRAEAQGS